MLGNFYGESKRKHGPVDPVEPEIVEKVAGMEKTTPIDIGEPISRKEALAFSREIIEQAEHERVAAPTDRELSACLARVIGIALTKGRLWGCDVYWYASTEDGQSVIWDPIHDANQMELVEAWLVRTSHGWSIETFGSQHIAEVWNKHPQMGSPSAWEITNHDKKRAFALAVREMEKSNDNNKED